MLNGLICCFFDGGILVIDFRVTLECDIYEDRLKLFFHVRFFKLCHSFD